MSKQADASEYALDSFDFNMEQFDGLGVPIGSPPQSEANIDKSLVDLIVWKVDCGTLFRDFSEMGHWLKDLKMPKNQKFTLFAVDQLPVNQMALAMIKRTVFHRIMLIDHIARVASEGQLQQRYDHNMKAIRKPICEYLHKFAGKLLVLRHTNGAVRSQYAMLVELCDQIEEDIRDCWEVEGKKNENVVFHRPDSAFSRYWAILRDILETAARDMDRHTAPCAQNVLFGYYLTRSCNSHVCLSEHDYCQRVLTRTCSMFTCLPVALNNQDVQVIAAYTPAPAKAKTPLKTLLQKRKGHECLQPVGVDHVELLCLIEEVSGSFIPSGLPDVKCPNIIPGPPPGLQRVELGELALPDYSEDDARIASASLSSGLSSVAGNAGNITAKVLINAVDSLCGRTVSEKDKVTIRDCEQLVARGIEGCVLGALKELGKVGSEQKRPEMVVGAAAAAVVVKMLLAWRRKRRHQDSKQTNKSGGCEVPDAVPGAAKSATKAFLERVQEGVQEIANIALGVLPSAAVIVGQAAGLGPVACKKLTVGVEAIRSGYHYVSGTKDENGNAVVDGLKLIENVGTTALGLSVSGAAFAATAAATGYVVVPVFLASLATHVVTTMATRAMAWYRSWWTWDDMNNEYTALCGELGFAEHTVTEVQINKAYRKMGLMYHPDSLRTTRNEARFVELSTKYKRLIELYTQLNKGGSMNKLYSAIVNSVDMVKRKANVCKVTFPQWEAWLASLVTSND